ncbi:flavodoxin [Halobacillus litoralis]|uniref:Flavodoxin n=1 Tax=Halobacillus litoralis TaxID=45668 RepID=A0A845DYP8_9BACI|nr:flavodoxin [Halobacillus litoralis]MYL21442.1 flavodoxin [Halobacillus litoralis]
MARILIGFASMSGNTEEMADLIKERLEEDHEIHMDELEEIEPGFLMDFDAVILGSYTWNDGDLPYEVEDFYEDLEDIDLTGKGIAVFGSGDTSYPQFCEAVHTFEERLTAVGGERMTGAWKVDMHPDNEEDIEHLQRFTDEIMEHLGHLIQLK